MMLAHSNGILMYTELKVINVKMDLVTVEFREQLSDHEARVRALEDKDKDTR